LGFPLRGPGLLSLAGSSGGLASRSRSVTISGLVGAWSWKEVQAIRRTSVAEKSGRLSKGQGWKGFLGDIKRSFESGTVANISNLNSVTTFGSSIMNDFYRAVQSNARASWSGTNTHAVIMAKLTGDICDVIDFADADGRYCLSAMVYYRQTELYPWTGSRMFLLSAAHRSSMDPLDYYDLAAVQSSDSEWYEMHRVGAAFGQRIAMAGENMSIQGVLF
jgi:hypothetical protein